MEWSYLLVAYLVAAVPFALVLTTLYGGDADVRVTGSGNIGATNVARVYGWGLAAPVLVLDVLKGFLPVLVAGWLWPEHGVWWQGCVAVVTFLGHCFPVYLEFRGGKGVATGAGALLAIAPVPVMVGILAWVLVLVLWGRSSVAALVAALVVALVCGVTEEVDRLSIVLLVVAGVAGTHLANIRRLLAGEAAQVIRPVRFSSSSTGAEVLRQNPAGGVESTSLWDECLTDPLALEEE